MSLTITEDLKKKGRMVLNYRNETVLKKYCIEYNVSKEDAELLFIEMLKFLYLCSISEKSLSPSKAIDKMWHTFILCTKDYAKFCEAHLGGFIHHNPDVELSVDSKASNRSAYQDAHTLGETIFAGLSLFAWPNPSTNLVHANCDADCTTPDCYICKNEWNRFIVYLLVKLNSAV